MKTVTRLALFGLALTLLAPAARSGEEEGAIQLAKFAKKFKTKEDRIARAAAVREGILKGANLSPLPQRAPLNPIINGKQELDGYTIENVAFESFPGFYVTGNLYKPTKIEGKIPAILNPHGHFPDNKEKHWFARTRPDMQARCGQFARMGAIAFAYDMVGYGESTQIPHTDPNALTYQLWNSLRVLDFLLAMSEVDPTRIGITGASGGGTQSFLAAAVDDRIAAAAPAVMVSAHFFGGCTCESGLPIHQDPETNNADIAACLAPRPLLLVSDGSDWTRFNPGVEMPYIWNVYRMFGAEKLVENAHLPFDQHDYGWSKREPVYRFFARHFRLPLLPPTNLKAENPTEALDPPEGIKVVDFDSLRVFGPNSPRPATCPVGIEGVAAAFLVQKR